MDPNDPSSLEILTSDDRDPESAEGTTDPALHDEDTAPDATEPTQDAAAQSAPAEEPERLDRRKLEEQLEALKRKESELRRALTIADHPELGEAVRVLEGRAYAVARVEAKLAQGPSKSEARRREAIGKKLASLADKRAELDAQIAQLEQELEALGADRSQLYEAERKAALEQLLVALGTHEAAFREAGIEVTGLVPDLGRLMPEIEALAESLVGAHAASTNTSDA